MTLSRQQLVQVRPEGLYCPQGHFWIDPLEAVETAILTHAHSDHARAGSQSYHATDISRGLLERRLGLESQLILHPYGEEFQLGPVTLSFHPAGHILGSAQVRLAYEDSVWLISGDYKRQADPTCAPFESVPCDVMITEATFGLPIYQWPSTEEVASDIFNWWQKNQAAGRNSILACYALGKAQRLLHALGTLTEEPIYTHGATENLVCAYREAGVQLPPTLSLADSDSDATRSRHRARLKGALILAPPNAVQSSWAKRFGESETALASGWMQLRGQRRRRGFDRGFVLSDHADWPALLASVSESQAKKVYVTHGYSQELARYLSEQGTEAEPLSTLFVRESEA